MKEKLSLFYFANNVISAKFLGILVDEILSWADHITIVENKTLQKL